MAKTFKKTYLPDSIQYRGHDLTVNIAASTGKTTAELKALLADKVWCKVIVTNPRLKGKRDLHGNPYPSTHWIFSN